MKAFVIKLTEKNKFWDGSGWTTLNNCILFSKKKDAIDYEPNFFNGDKEEEIVAVEINVCS